MSNNSPSLTIIFSVWDGDWALLEEYDANGNRIEGYLQGYHGLVKTLVSNIYYYQDELGSTSHVANSSGALLEYYKYNLYGKPTYFDAGGNLLTSSANGVHDLFTGQRWIPEIGLYDDRNRFMSPDLGRFLQPDPIGLKGDASNLYRYCGNDWANRSDPMGLDPAEQKANVENSLHDDSRDIGQMAERVVVSASSIDPQPKGPTSSDLSKGAAFIQNMRSAFDNIHVDIGVSRLSEDHGFGIRPAAPPTSSAALVNLSDLPFSGITCETIRTATSLALGCNLSAKTL